MDIAALLFLIGLLIPAIVLILFVGYDIRKRVMDEKGRKGVTPPRLQSETTAQQQALIRERAVARREAAEQRAERWKNLTPSLVNQAFRNFYEDEAAASFDASHVSAAFEKFTQELRVKQ
jgi:hypothetical protein